MALFFAESRQAAAAKVIVHGLGAAAKTATS